MLTGHRQITHIDARILASFGALNIHPLMAVPGLFIRIGEPLIADVLIFTGDKAVVAVVAERNVYYHIMLFHF
jgi:hypothetical protein